MLRKLWIGFLCLCLLSGCGGTPITKAPVALLDPALLACAAEMGCVALNETADAYGDPANPDETAMLADGVETVLTTVPTTTSTIPSTVVAMPQTVEGLVDFCAEIAKAFGLTREASENYAGTLYYKIRSLGDVSIWKHGEITVCWDFSGAAFAYDIQPLAYDMTALLNGEPTDDPKAAITVGFTDGCDVVLSPDAFNCLGPALYRAAEQLYTAMSDHVYG